MIRPQTFLFEIQDGIARITLDRPEAYNALTFQVYRELTDLFADLSEEPGVRVVVISGRGKSFCSGGDVREIIGPLLSYSEADLLQFTRMTCELIWNMRTLEHPIIASLNGVTAGAGAMIALASDFRIAEESARIAFLFVKVGLSGADMGACYLLPRVVGFGKATELLMTGEFIGAMDAARIGLFHKVVPQFELTSVTNEFARRLAEGPANGLAVTKRLLNAETLPYLKEALEMEAKAQGKCMQHPDFKEGYNAFMEKRPPRFNR